MNRQPWKIFHVATSLNLVLQGDKLVISCRLCMISWALFIIHWLTSIGFMNWFHHLHPPTTKIVNSLPLNSGFIGIILFIKLWIPTGWSYAHLELDWNWSKVARDRNRSINQQDASIVRRAMILMERIMAFVRVCGRDNILKMDLYSSVFQSYSCLTDCSAAPGYN